MKKTTKLLGAVIGVLLAAALLAGAGAAAADLVSANADNKPAGNIVLIYLDDPETVPGATPVADNKVKAGEDFWIQIASDKPYQTFAIADTDFISAVKQEYVEKKTIPSFPGVQNVFTSGKGGFNIKVTAANAAETRQADFVLLKLTDDGWVQDSVNSVTIVSDGNSRQTTKTPGFGILAALAGLGAAAVFFLRRQ